MATSPIPIPPLPADELRRQAAEFRSAANQEAQNGEFDRAAELSSQAEDFERQANELEATTATPQQPHSPSAVDSTTDRVERLQKGFKRRFISFNAVLGIAALFFLVLVLGVWLYTRGEKPTVSPAQTKPVATEPAKTATQFTPSNSRSAAPATRDLTGQAPSPAASSPNLALELQKLRNEIEGLKKRTPATTPAAPTINFPRELTVRLVPSQEGNQQTVQQPEQPSQPASQPERRRLSDKEAADEFWRDWLQQRP